MEQIQSWSHRDEYVRCPRHQCAKRYHMRLELNIDFCNGFFYILAAGKSLNSVCRRNGRFSCSRSTRKSLLHKAPADFSTVSGENSAADGANSRQNQGVSVVLTGASVLPWRQAHRPRAWRWPLRQDAFSDDHHLGGSGADISPFVWGCWGKRDRVAFPEDMPLVPQPQGHLAFNHEGKLLAPRRRRKYPATSFWRHDEHDGLQLSRLIQGRECVDRDRRPGTGQLRTSTGAHQMHRARLWLREKLSEADPQSHGNALQRPNGWRDLAVFRLGNKAGRKASLGGQGPYRHP